MPQSDFWPFRNLAREDDTDSSVLQRQLGDMEGEVKEIQMELAAIRKNRMQLNPTHSPHARDADRKVSYPSSAFHQTLIKCNELLEAIRIENQLNLVTELMKCGSGVVVDSSRSSKFERPVLTADTVELDHGDTIRDNGGMLSAAGSSLHNMATRKVDHLDTEFSPATRKYQANHVQIIQEPDTTRERCYSPTAVLQREDRPTSKFPEIIKLREELIKAKNAADEEKIQREKYETKLKDLEHKLNHICYPKVPDPKETKINNESEIAILKSQVRESREENEELKISLSERDEQLQEYRLKYIQAQQQVEELRRQQDLIEFDNKQVSEQIQLEIQKMKMQFQEKLQELAPLPDLLKGAQIQLQEAKQFQRLAEDNSQQLSSELHRVKEKLVQAVSSLTVEKNDKIKLHEEVKGLKMDFEEKQKEIDILYKENDEFKCTIMRFKERLVQHEALYDDKASECATTLRELEELREESARALARCKERSDSMRRYLQTQVSELERQLIQSRAQCRACQKERDEIRQRMQVQISSLQENFDMVEIKLRTLQGQVTSMKNNYTQLLVDDEEHCDMIKMQPIM